MTPTTTQARTVAAAREGPQVTAHERAANQNLVVHTVHYQRNAQGKWASGKFTLDRLLAGSALAPAYVSGLQAIIAALERGEAVQGMIVSRGEKGQGDMLFRFSIPKENPNILLMKGFELKGDADHVEEVLESLRQEVPQHLRRGDCILLDKEVSALSITERIEAIMVDPAPAAILERIAPSTLSSAASLHRQESGYVPSPPAAVPVPEQKPAIVVEGRGPQLDILIRNWGALAAYLQANELPQYRSEIPGIIVSEPVKPGPMPAPVTPPPPSAPPGTQHRSGARTRISTCPC